MNLIYFGALFMAKVIVNLNVTRALKLSAIITNKKMAHMAVSFYSLPFAVAYVSRKYVIDFYIWYKLYLDISAFLNWTIEFNDLNMTLNWLFNDDNDDPSVLLSTDVYNRS